MVYGGLTEISEDKDVCPSAETLLISMDTECTGKHVATVPDFGKTLQCSIYKLVCLLVV